MSYKVKRPAAMAAAVWAAADDEEKALRYAQAYVRNRPFVRTVTRIAVDPTGYIAAAKAEMDEKAAGEGKNEGKGGPGGIPAPEPAEEEPAAPAAAAAAGPAAAARKPAAAAFAGAARAGASDFEVWYRTFQLDMNGAEDSVVAAQPRSYIEAKAFKAIAESDSEDVPAQFLRLMELLLDFVHLGKDLPALIGANLRFTLRELFVRTRECKVYNFADTTMHDEVTDYLDRFKALSEKHRDLIALINVNARSFAAQAGANLYTKMHHWDAKRVKEWDALYASIGVSDDVERTVDALRPIVYLALHPLPIPTINAFRNAARGEASAVATVSQDNEKLDAPAQYVIPVEGYVNTVVLRAGGIPAGNAPFAISVVVWDIIANEGWFPLLVEYLDHKRTDEMKYAAFKEFGRDLRESGEKFHLLAREYGEEPAKIPVENFTRFMEVAYAYTVVFAKGSLSSSVSFKKWADSRMRAINLWVDRFRKDRDLETDPLTSFLRSWKENRASATRRLAELREETKLAEAERDLARLRAPVAAAAGPAPIV